MNDEQSNDREENEFGPFGTGVKPVRFRSLAKYSHVITFLMLLCLVPGILWGWNYIYWNYLEAEPPLIELTKLPAGLGGEGNEIAFRIRDRGTGLQRYEIRLVQKDKSFSLLHKDFSAAREEETVSLIVNAKDRGLSEGDASIVVSATDRAFQPNTSSLPVVLRVDFQSPGIEFISGDLEYAAGATGFLCYRISETSDILSGVTFRTFLFPGLPAKGLNPDFAPFPNIFCAFFPIPFQSAGSLSSIRLFVRDPAGNTGGIDLPVKVRETPPPLSSEVVPENESVLALEKKRKQSFDEKMFEAAEEELMPLFSRPKPQAFWTGSFRRPNGEARYRLADNVTFKVGKPFTLSSRETFFSMAAGTPVRSSADGIIIYADELDTFGKTMIVDHGFGIASMYTHLAQTMKREGDRVSISDEIGVAGKAALSPGEGYGYSLRAHGIPVREGEWDDPVSFRRLYTERLVELRKKLGIKIVRILD